jgi:hypothetical protein
MTLSLAPSSLVAAIATGGEESSTNDTNLT